MTLFFVVGYTMAPPNLGHNYMYTTKGFCLNGCPDLIVKLFFVCNNIIMFPCPDFKH